MLENIAGYGYPPSLRAEEEAFVRATLDSGDMIDIRAAYQADPAGRTGFWVVEEEAEEAVGGDGPGGTLVGCVGLRHGNLERDGDGAADIGRFAVDSRFRGRGAARLLLAALEAHARDNEFTIVTATTVSLNTAALGTFAACGWAEVYRGRADGKPPPEWVPFVRVRKLLGHSEDP